MTVTYKSGDYLVVKVGNSDIQYEIIECGFNQIRIIDTLTRIESSRTIADIDELVVSGSAVIHQKNIKERKLLKSDAIDFASYPETLKQEARDRYIYVIDLLERQLPSLSAVRIAPVIEEIYSSNTFELLKKKPSERSVQRWVSNYIKVGNSIRGLISGNANKGNRKAKVTLLAEPYIHSAIEHFKQLERPTIANSYDHLQTLIHFDNIKIEDVANKLKVMTQTAFIKRLEKEAPKQLMIARLGKEEANKHFKTSKLPQEITQILQRVESDHTQLDLFLVDAKENFILGRPYVTALLDYKSKSILGFYIGFEKPSYLSIARALRHAILPKSYVKELYPDVKSDYACYGLPRVLVVDRGKDFESIALTDTCLDLNIRIQRNPGKHPWYKGSIESYFKTLNNSLLNDMKGKVFPDIVDSNSYKPQKHAVITMSLFLKFFHIWLIDIYHQKKVSSGKIIPHVSWKEDLDRVPLRTMNKDALDIVLAERASRKNSSDGILFDYILYESDELAKIRAETGFRKLEFKYNRENLGFIYVLDDRNPRDKTYITVPALNQKYAKGLSRHQHKITLAFNRKYLDGKIDLESLAEAKMKIKELIKDHLNSRKDNLLATTQNISRWEGIGQQSDQSVKSSLREEPAKGEYKGIPKPSVAINKTDKPTTSEISGFDGKHNTLPDELDF